MIYFEITTAAGKVIAENMRNFARAEKYRGQENFSDHIKGFGAKGLHEIDGDGIGVWIVVENEKDFLKSSKKFRELFDFYREIAVGTWRIQKEQLTGTRHILPNIHTQMVQALDLFTGNNPSVFYGESLSSVINGISKKIQSNSADAARLIVYLNKLILDMAAHLRGVDVIHFGANYKPEMKEVSGRAAILHQYASFTKEFDEAFIQLRVNTIDDDAIVTVDKNMFSLVMYNLLSNALKYCMPESEVRFHFSNESKELDVSMISLRIEQDEIRIISNDGVRGKHAKKTSGSGIGLFVIKNALDKMKKQPMRIQPNYQKTENFNGEPYVENHFHINLS